MPKPPSSNVRLTITVTPEVHAAFKRLADAGSMSISRAMGDWLGDTVDAANFMATTMEKARQAPRMVAQELHAYALGLGDETGELLRKIRSGQSVTVGDARSAPQPAPTARRTAPPSNTGVTTNKAKARKGGIDGKNPH